MEKLDLKKQLKHLYRPSPGEVVRVDVPPMHYLMVDGAGDPNTSQMFTDAVAALYSLSYTLKFMVKKGPSAIDYGVMPLEGLWWADDMTTFTVEDKAHWRWTLMIMQPDFITRERVDAAVLDVTKKKNLSALARVRFETLTEGACAQIMHIGPFSDEGPTVEKVHQFISRCGRNRAGKHHEIYLSDMRKADPKKWKTIIRQPMH